MAHPVLFRRSPAPAVGQLVVDHAAFGPASLVERDDATRGELRHVGHPLAVAPTQVEAISDYADLWLKDVAPNQPIRANGKDLSPELGQPTFSKALAAWNAIR